MWQKIQKKLQPTITTYKRRQNYSAEHHNSATMGGRQAHGRPLVAAPKAKTNTNKKSKARSQKNALDAFGIAQEKFAPKQKRTQRARELDAEIERKHGREDGEDEEGEEEEEPRRKKVKRPGRSGEDFDDPDDGSDSEGNEWRLGGLREDDEDSEIESDDAFGESDDEKFSGYTFRGSKATQDKVCSWSLLDAMIY